jgi:DNA-binding MarR family transcriptional regulator
MTAVPLDPAPDEAAAPSHLILELLSAFYWFDEGLQNYLTAHGWPEVTRPQSMLMGSLAMGLHRPSDIARQQGVSRQAIHTTIGQLVDKGVLELVDDRADRRMKSVELTAKGEDMKRDAQTAMRMMVEELGRRIGPKKVAQLREATLSAWGEPMAFDAASSKV